MEEGEEEAKEEEDETADWNTETMMTGEEWQDVFGASDKEDFLGVWTTAIKSIKWEEEQE